MALIDFLERAENVLNAPAGAENALTMADIEMATAQKMQENRMRREELQKKIENLRSQKAELEAQKEKLRTTSLSNMDEDKIVAMAKAKGIKNEDIDAWLRGRAQRSARMISEGQRLELGRGAKAQEMANRDAAIQAIFEAKKELAEAKAEEKLASAEMKEAKGEAVTAAANKFETLKAQFEKTYDEKWSDIDRSAPRTQKSSESAPVAGEESVTVKVTLSPEEIGALRTNEPGLLEKFRSGSGISYDERIAIKGKAQDYIAGEDRKRREEAEEKAKKDREREEEEERQKEKARLDRESTRDKIKADAKNPNLSESEKDRLVSRYRNTFKDTDERTPSRTDVRKILFGE